MKRQSPAGAVSRIESMERLFDRLLKAYSESPDAFRNDTALRAALAQLMDYYENGQWLADYMLDEQGLLPAGLKRGVLSEDGIYNLLSDLESENILSENHI